LLRARALDNLLSCVLILAVLGNLKRSGIAADVVGVLHACRGGRVHRCRRGAAQPASRNERPLVVLETSKEMAGVRMGAGPVLRVGDRMTTFDPGMDLWLASRAAALAAAEPDFCYQRALMTGGACEASLYMLHGRRTGAIALALGNYHNMTPEGGIGAEYISMSDFDNALLLLEDWPCIHPRATSWSGGAKISMPSSSASDRACCHRAATLEHDLQHPRLQTRTPGDASRRAFGVS
jgi:endoglucanase